LPLLKFQPSYRG